MKKGIVLIVTAFLLALSLFALAEDLPVVNDAASVLDTTTIQDIQQLNQQMEKALDVSLRVETKDFLGGEQPAQYARALREGSDKADKTILLVMVIGEERYAVSIGSAAQAMLRQDAAENQLASSFRQAFLNREYSGAVNSVLTQWAAHMQKSSGNSFDAGRYETPVVKPTSRITNPLDSFFREWDKSEQSARQYQEEAHDAKEYKGGPSFWQIVIIGFVLYKIFGRNKYTDKRRGCGPLGWIFGTWGLSKFFGFRK